MSAEIRQVALDTDSPIWSRFFTVAPLVLVGTREPDGSYDLAPKHMAMPLGWQNFYCFVCSPRHATQRNAERTGEFTVSFPNSYQVLQASMAASGREPDDTKPGLAALKTFTASSVDGELVEGCYLWLECRLDRVVDGYGENSLIIGEVVAAAADEQTLRDPDRDDADLLHDSALLAYLSPGRFTTIRDSNSFPFSVDCKL